MSALALTLSWLALAQAAPISRDVTDPTSLVDLSGVWQFHADDYPAFSRASLDDLGWEQRQVPTANTRWAFRWAGKAWYRHHFRVSPDAIDYDYMLTLGPAREVAEVYVNGALVAQRGEFGSRPKGGTSVLPLTGISPTGVLVPGDNVLAVRLYDPTWAGGLPAGPILLGPPELVRAEVENERWASLALRIVLALFALGVGIAQIFINRGRKSYRESFWMLGAGFGLALVHAAETGVLTLLLPTLDLATRLPIVAGPLAILCLASYFAARFGGESGVFSIGQGVLVTLTALVLLAPDKVVFLVAGPLVLVSALVADLYAAYVLLQAARRAEKGALPVFASLVFLALLIVYDGLTHAPASNTWPPLSFIGAVGVLLVSTLVSARQAAMDHDGVIARMLRLEKRLEDHVRTSLLDGTRLAFANPEAFLELVVQEAARALEVRRCSLVLSRGDTLELAAGVGLPKHTVGKQIPKEGSIAGWVFARGEAVIDTRMPEELVTRRRGGSAYNTESFISYPIRTHDRVLGVMNVSDRNNGGAFSQDDEAAVQTTAQNLAVVLTRMGIAPLVAAPVQQPTEVPVLQPQPELVSES